MVLNIFFAIQAYALTVFNYLMDTLRNAPTHSFNFCFIYTTIISSVGDIIHSYMAALYVHIIIFFHRLSNKLRLVAQLLCQAWYDLRKWFNRMFGPLPAPELPQHYCASSHAWDIVHHFNFEDVKYPKVPDDAVIPGTRVWDRRRQHCWVYRLLPLEYPPVWGCDAYEMDWGWAEYRWTGNGYLELAYWSPPPPELLAVPARMIPGTVRTLSIF
jgi:hypothetical protein